MRHILSSLLKSRENGTSTIEFAIIFPFLFIIIFYCILLIFWFNDASITTYEAGRLSRLGSVGITIEADDAVYAELIDVPTINRFQDNTNTTISYSVDGSSSRIESSVMQHDSLINPLLIRLTLLRDDEMDNNAYLSQEARVIRWVEPYLRYKNE